MTSRNAGYLRRSLTLALVAGVGSMFAGCGRDVGSSATASAVTNATRNASSSEATRIAPPPPTTLVKALGADEQSAMNSLPVGTARELVTGDCLICHSASMIEQQHKDTTGWNKTVSQMIAWGAPVQPVQTHVLIAYLAQHFPARAGGSPARPVP